MFKMYYGLCIVTAFFYNGQNLVNCLVESLVEKE